MNVWTATVKKNSFGEYVVRFFRNGQWMNGMNYYTDDKADAMGTRKVQLASLTKHELVYAGEVVADYSI